MFLYNAERWSSVCGFSFCVALVWLLCGLLPFLSAWLWCGFSVGMHVYEGAVLHSRVLCPVTCWMVSDSPNYPFYSLKCNDQCQWFKLLVNGALPYSRAPRLVKLDGIRLTERKLSFLSLSRVCVFSSLDRAPAVVLQWSYSGSQWVTVVLQWFTEVFDTSLVRQI